MLRLRFWAALLAAASAFSEPSSTVRQAVFSNRQLFWPDLAGKSKPVSRSKEKGPVRIGVLPIHLRDYHESIPCDSCHRLSDNGMEFFLENYLKDRMQARFPKSQVDLIAPQFPLLQSANIDLPAYLDSLQFPFDSWFDGYSQDLIYRPKDRMTPAGTRARLDRLGGILGASHLLIPARVSVQVTPRSSNTHSGGLDWSFFLVLWNIAEGRPEWALNFSEKIPDTDLDRSLEGDLDKALNEAWDKLPADLTALWKAEPR